MVVVSAKEEDVDGRVVVVSAIEEDVDERVVVVSAKEEDVDGSLAAVYAKEEDLDGGLAAVYATEVEDSKDGSLVVGFVKDGDSMEGELVEDWEGKRNVVERLFVVSSLVVED